MARFLHGTNQTDTSSRFSSSAKITQRERRNGWSCPWHPLQLIAWGFLIYFAIIYFGILVFYLPLEWRPAGLIVPGGLYVFHIVVHILALSIDPADPNIRQGSYHEKAEFDRNNYAHVIENCHCHICQADVSPKSKHCSSCNKCVSAFDHHCKWLNTCVGGRNYKLFLATVASAFAGALLKAAVTLYVFIMFFIDKSSLRKSDAKFHIFLPVSDAGFVIFVGINVALYLLAMCLLGHLLGFHIYLICLNMSTYEFIVNSRDKKAQIKAESTVCEGTPIALERIRNNKVLPTLEGMESGELSVDASQHERPPSSVDHDPEPTVKVMNEVSSKVVKRNSTSAPNHNPQNRRDDAERAVSEKPNQLDSADSSSSLHELPAPSPNRIETVTVHSPAPPPNRIDTFTVHPPADRVNTEITGKSPQANSAQHENNSSRKTTDNISNQETSDSDGEELIPINSLNKNSLKVELNHEERKGIGRGTKNSGSPPEPYQEPSPRLPPLTKRPLPQLGDYDNLSNC